VNHPAHREEKDRFGGETRGGSTLKQNLIPQITKLRSRMSRRRHRASTRSLIHLRSRAWAAGISY
jgi:hypothetical protein